MKKDFWSNELKLIDQVDFDKVRQVMSEDLNKKRTTPDFVFITSKKNKELMDALLGLTDDKET